MQQQLLSLLYLKPKTTTTFSHKEHTIVVSKVSNKLNPTLTMSNDMSMFKKMKERITDEVNSATNKIQNMQIMDQLTSSIGQQIKGEPNQLLPTPQDSSFSSSSNLATSISRNYQLSLIEDGPIIGYNEDEEINNSEISPQHQLFNEHSIKRLDQRPISNSHETIENGILLSQNISESVRTQVIEDRQNFSDDKNSVINIEELSSDLEDEFYCTHDSGSKEDGPEDVEIDLLSDRPIPSSNNNAINTMDNKSDGDVLSGCLSHYKTRYRTLVHAIRRLNQEYLVEKSKLESQKQNLESRSIALKTELDNLKKESLNISESDKSVAGSPQPMGKASTKIKDLERLLAKCKESLKTKNSQIQALKDSLCEVEKYKEFNQELKNELAELREAHETWTVSIAENKRAMHQEMENKNAEVEQAKAETNEVQLRFIESNTKLRQLKSAIQDLESRLVSTSAAHQKERESLTKELTLAKNTAIRQLQREHEHILERAKLDLEKSIGSLKLDMLKKDEQIVRSVTKQEELQAENQRLIAELETSNQRFEEQLKRLNESNNNLQTKCSELETELKSQKNEVDKNLVSKNTELANEIDTLREELSLIETIKSDLEKRLKESESFYTQCKRCETLDKELSSQSEKFQQDLHVVTTRLDLMTTANDDQEKEIRLLKSERDSSNELLKNLKTEIEELSKKNDTLSRVIQENEADMQTQQDQLDKLTSMKHELEFMRKENALLDDHLSRLKNEFNEKNSEFNQLKGHNDDLLSQLSDLKTDLSNTYKLSEVLKQERDSLIANNDEFRRHQKLINEQLVVKILTAMKNLETPNTSPGSDKSYEPSRQGTGDNQNKSLPDPMGLMEDLVSLALDRSNSYMTASNRLQAVLLDNTMMGEELKRLKDELNHLNREKTLDSQTSIEETEKLLRENQALIHDQQSYDERIKILEDELVALTDRLEAKKSEPCHVTQEHENDVSNIPDSMEFEYLKNIVYQFMLGKEPLVLARVISAVFKFDKSQIDQICKVQEAVQSSLKQSI